jgi:Tfp pilus assembly protein PilO
MNLTPQEQRLVVAIALVVFVVLNVWFVWPHFKDLSRLKKQQQNLQADLARYKRLIDQAPVFKRDLEKLQKMGVELPTESMVLEFVKTVMAQAALSGVTIINYTPVQSAAFQTNQYFEERTLQISVNTGEKELVDFLYGLSSGGSLIRVKSMSLQPDQPRMRLTGNISLVASYQRQTPLKPATAAPVAAGKTGAVVTAKTNVTSPRTTPTTLPGKTNKVPLKPTATPTKKP